MAMTKDQYIFVFINCKKLKQKGKSLTLITYHAYSHDKQLCAVDALKEYILITSDFWNDRNCNRLLLCVITPDKPVVLSITSGWVKKVLNKARVIISTIKAHYKT